HARLARMSPAQRAVARVTGQAAVIRKLRSSGAEDGKWWWAAAYDAARKPGSDHNPILAKGEPSLTQAMVNEYAGFLASSRDRSLMGGWRAARLKAMQELVVTDWGKTTDNLGRDAFLADLKWWKETFPRLSDAERKRAKLEAPRAYRTYVAKTAGEDE